MSYFYVDSTIGTRTTGGGTTKQTGTFDALGAATLYATIELAITDGAGSGDFVLCAARHAETSAALITIAGPTVAGQPVYIMCVETNNCDTITVSTILNVDATSIGDVRFTGKVYVYGLWFKSVDDIEIFAINGSLTLEKCTLEVNGTFDNTLKPSSTGWYIRLIDPTFDITGLSACASPSRGVEMIVEGGTIKAGAPYYLYQGFGTGGAKVTTTGLDMSALTSTVCREIGGSYGNDQNISLQFFNCKTPATVTWLDETFQKPEHRLEAFNCANTDAIAEYQFHIEAYGGVVDDQVDTGIHRNETTAFPSGSKISAHIVTDTLASIAEPFWFNLPSMYAELSVATTDTLRIYLASTTALDDTDVWVEVMYKDGTNGQILNRITTQNTDRLTVASAGTALTTDSGSTWKDGGTDLVGYNEYYIDVDTSVDVGADCVPEIKIFVAKPSIVVYLDPVIDLVA